MITQKELAQEAMRCAIELDTIKFKKLIEIGLDVNYIHEYQFNDTEISRSSVYSKLLMLLNKNIKSEAWIQFIDILRDNHFPYKHHADLPLAAFYLAKKIGIQTIECN